MSRWAQQTPTKAVGMPKGNTPPGLRGLTSAWRPALLGHWPGVAGHNGAAVAVDQPEPRPASQGELTEPEAATTLEVAAQAVSVAVCRRRSRPECAQQDGNETAGTVVDLTAAGRRHPAQGKECSMGRRLVTILLMTMALSAVGAVMAAGGALADPKTATFTIQLSGAAEVCPTAPGTCGGPGTGTATITIDRNARTLVLCHHHPERGPAADGRPHPCRTRR